MSALALNVFLDSARSAKALLLEHLECCPEDGAVLRYQVVRQDESSIAVLWLCNRCGRSFFRARGEVVGRYRPATRRDTQHLGARPASWKL